MRRTHISHLCIRIICFFVIVILLLTGCSHKNRPSQADSFDQLCQDIFTSEVSSTSMNLHFSLENPSSYGITTPDSYIGHLPNDETVATINSYLDLLSSISLSNLREDQKLTYDMLRNDLTLSKELIGYHYFHEYLSPKGGEQVELFLLLSELPIHNLQEADEFLCILANVPSYLDELLTYEQEKSSFGLFMSDEQLSETLSSMKDMKKLLSEGFLSDSFRSRILELADISEDVASSYETAASDIITHKILPSYESLYKGLSDLKGTGVNSLGLCYFQDGREYYELLLQSMLRSDLVVEDLYKDIQEQLNKDLVTCSKLYSKNPSLLEDAKDVHLEFEDEESILFHLVESIGTRFPQACTTSYELQYANVALAPYIAPAYYLTAPFDNPDRNLICINSAKDDSRISYFATLAHEGFPGHLYQTTMSYQYEVPWIRLLLGCPSYTEGWATYVELLSYEYAGLDTTLAQYLAHNRSAILGLYALSDIGIHYYGWNEYDLQQFWAPFGVTSASTIHDIAKLIIASPGNYLKYYGGYLEILKLKEKASDTYGNQFLEYDFHRTLLRMGPAPFDLINKYYDSYFSRSI